MNHTPSKRSLRSGLKASLDAIPSADRYTISHQLVKLLLQSGLPQSSDSILAYASFANELSLDPFIAAALNQGKRIAIPSIDWTHKSMSAKQITNLDTDLIPGRYDIRVPREGCALVEPEQIDVILLPGLAFDRAGNRLGRGAGFYDRYISALKESGHNPTLIGVCYHAQIVDSVPTEPHDHRVDRVITELGPLEPQ